MARKKSIMQTKKECFLTGRTDDLHCHHIYFGTGNRQVSDQNGFWIWLTGEWHNQDTRKSVHFDIKLDNELKELCQIQFERTHSRDEFRELIGKSYL